MSYLLLEDGPEFKGESVGANTTAFGEAVFTTAMSGYQEVVTDPSFSRQIVCFTAPMIGNYGVAETRSESDAVHATGVLMREARGPAWTTWLREHNIAALTASTRARSSLHLRERGAMRSALVAGTREVDDGAGPPPAPAWTARALAGGVSTTEPYVARTPACPHRGRRLRHEALDPPPPRRLRRRGHRLPAQSRRRHARGLRRRAALERPRRPGAARRRGRDHQRAARPRAGARHLPRPPAARARERPRHVQAAVRPSRREPPGARTRHRPCARDEPEPRLRRRRERRHGRHPPFALRRHRRRARLPELRARSVQFHPEAGPGPHDAWPILSDWVEEVRLAAS